MTEWAILVPFPDCGKIYVTEMVEGMDFTSTSVKTFATREEAEHAADMWRLPGKEDLVEVVEYDKNTE